MKYGQAVHAEMMRAEFESARRDRPNNGGTMMWMYNDCWPTSNWSIIDYYRRPKPSYYAARRACATHLPIIFERGGRIEFSLSNDGRERCHADVTFGVERLDGTQVWAIKTWMRVGGCETARFHYVDRADLELSPGEFLFIEAEVDGRVLPKVTYFPDMWRDIEWPTPNVRVEVLGQESHGDESITRLRLTTDAYARFCHVVLPEEARPFWLDGNFFDLPAGSSHEVTVRSARPLDPSQITLGHWHTDWP